MKRCGRGGGGSHRISVWARYLPPLKIPKMMEKSNLFATLVLSFSFFRPFPTKIGSIIGHRIEYNG